MNGGADEYMMGNYGYNIGRSGFSNLPGHQYLDVYFSASAKRVYGIQMLQDM